MNGNAGRGTARLTANSVTFETLVFTTEFPPAKITKAVQFSRFHDGIPKVVQFSRPVDLPLWVGLGRPACGPRLGAAVVRDCRLLDTGNVYTSLWDPAWTVPRSTVRLTLCGATSPIRDETFPKVEYMATNIILRSFYSSCCPPRATLFSI